MNDTSTTAEEITYNSLDTVNDDEMALSEHIEEFSQRIVFCVMILVVATLFCFTDVKEIVRIFQAPAVGVKFLQFSPGEYFFASVKIAAFCGIFFSFVPIIFFWPKKQISPKNYKKNRSLRA